MLTIRSLVPALALAGALALAPSADAAGFGYGSTTSSFASGAGGQRALTAATSHGGSTQSNRAMGGTASRSGGEPMVVSTKSTFGGKQTVTHIEADGSSRNVTTKRGLFGGRKVDVTHSDAAGNTTYRSSTTTGRKGDVKEHSAAGSGWSTSTATRTNFLTGTKTTEFAEHNQDGSSSSGTRQTYHDGRVKKSDTVEKDSNGYTTTGKESRGFFTNNLKRNTTVTDSNDKTVMTGVEKFRDNETIKKAVVRQGGDKVVTKFDKQERVKKETITSQFGQKTTTKNSY